MWKLIEFKYVVRSFFILFGDNSSLFDLHFFDILSESALDGLDDSGLVSLESIEVSSSSDFEFGDSSAFFDEDGYVKWKVLFLVALVLDLSVPLGSLRSPKNSLTLVISFGWITNALPFGVWL